MRSHRTPYITLCLLIVMTVILAGCRPKGILHSGQMRRLLVDLHKTEAAIQLSGYQYGHDEAQDIYYAQVLEKHGVTQAQFDSSIVWYTSHPVLFDKIYPKVQADLKAEHEAFLAEYGDQLNLKPAKNDDETEPVYHKLTYAQLDSMLWVTQHGMSTTWKYWQRPYRLNVEEIR